MTKHEAASGMAAHMPVFLALTLVVIFVFLISSQDAATAILAAGLAVLAYREWERRREPPRRERAAVPPRRQEHFNVALPGAPPPYPIAAQFAPGDGAAGPYPPVTRYPGAIDADEYDSEDAFGHRDRTAGDNDGAPEGNPYDRCRTTAPTAAPPCIDDEANDDEIEGDERIAYQGLARNDPDRVVAGIMNRRRWIDPYVREELEEAEDERWWGRHEV